MNSASMAWPKASRTWHSSPRRAASPMPNGWRCSSNTRPPCAGRRQFESRARAAKLRQAASVEDVDYRAVRGLDRSLFLKLADCDWIRAKHNLLITGPCGVGKCWLACALGQKACREDLATALSPHPPPVPGPGLGTRRRPIHKDAAPARPRRLLILDDWGPETLSADQRRDLLEIVEDRYDARSIIITSQVPIERWYEIIGDPTIADAILDRLVHNAYRIELTGESMRKAKRKETPLDALNRNPQLQPKTQRAFPKVADIASEHLAGWMQIVAGFRWNRWPTSSRSAFLQSVAPSINPRRPEEYADNSSCLKHQSKSNGLLKAAANGFSFYYGFAGNRRPIRSISNATIRACRIA